MLRADLVKTQVSTDAFLRRIGGRS